jgi:hypothetical protein
MAGILVAYRHYEQPKLPEKHDHVKSFLAMIVVQMMPLVALELKIMSCADPVGLFCDFARPVTIIHAIFLAMRFCAYPCYDHLYLTCSGLGLLAAIYTLVHGFPSSPKATFHHKCVIGLVSASLLGSLVATWLGDHLSSANPASWLLDRIRSVNLLLEVFETSTAYLEIMAFVPAVWMVYREDKATGRHQIEELDSKRTATAFFLFLVVFYLSEDLLNGVQAWDISGLATAAHIFHFCLLLDVACYCLAHIYNPEKLTVYCMGELRKWLPIDLYCEV